jgi:hypothetical protein
MLYNQTYNLDQVAFASEGLKDAQQTMTAMKAANKELKGMMKTVKLEDIDVRSIFLCNIFVMFSRFSGLQWIFVVSLFSSVSNCI